MSKNKNMSELLSIMARLRDKENGCPWDIKQTYQTIAPHTIEEAYEVADAVDRGNMEDLKEELGDLLLQVVFHSQMASEDGHFDFHDVVNALKEKLIRRHPHIFGDQTAETAEDVKKVWDGVKAKEKEGKGKDGPSPLPSILDGIPPNLPTMYRAWKMARVTMKDGFDWPDMRSCCANLREEIDELLYEVEHDMPDERIKDELGDILFSSMTIAAKLDINPEESLRLANMKFQSRYRTMEAIAHEKNQKLAHLEEEDRENLWKEAKKHLKNAQN